MKKLLAILFSMAFLSVITAEIVAASFFFTRYEDKRVNGKNIHKTSHIGQIDWEKWSFGTEVGTAEKGYVYVIPYVYHNIPFLPKGWQGGFRYKHDSLRNDSFAPSLCYAKVNEVWKGHKLLFLFEADYFLGDQERLELWGNITTPGYGWRIALERFFAANRFGGRNFQLRFPRIEFRFHRFGPFKSFTPFVMFEHQWNGWNKKSVQSNSGFLGIKFNW